MMNNKAMMTKKMQSGMKKKIVDKYNSTCKYKNIGILIGNLRPGAFYNLSQDLCEGFFANGVEKIHLFYILDDLDNVKFPPNVFLHKMPASRARFILFPLIKLLRKTDLDLLISFCAINNINAIIAKALAGKKTTKLLISEHSLLSFDSKKRYAGQLKWKIVPTMAKIFYPYANAIYVPNESILEDLKKTYNISFKANKRLTINNPVSYTKISLALKKEIKPLQFKKPIFINVARLNMEKNHAFLIRAFKLLTKKMDASLIILGNGKEKENLIRLIHEENLDSKVHLLGYQPNPWSIMKKSDIFVLTSISESFGLVIVEAMMCGLPIIASDESAGGPRNILMSGKYGILVTQQSEQAYADAMYRLWKSKETYLKYVALSEERSKDFNPKKITKKILTFMENT